MITLAVIACAAFLATFAGGMFALRLSDKLHLVLGFSAGAVVAVAFFDLLPEAITLGEPHHSPATLLTWTAVGFLLYLVLDRAVLLYGKSLGNHHHAAPSSGRGTLGAGSLSAHSFLDGLAIGIAFQDSFSVGAIVTAAVLTHDFSDGINTMNIVMKNSGDRKLGIRWLVIDASAPVLGIIATLFISLPPQDFSLALAMFAGFFLYLGASDLIPESHHSHPQFLTTAMTLLGALVLYTAIRVIGD
ncbi:MAG TPA: ZIP family metal transporter [Pseudomonadales bacterium]|nr:ZIP family metal transporter [Pseudomonadales bacterium]